ncbi:MAG TPA: hypothetical protein VII99_08640, partial [Bacteroidia bacterium]
MAVPPIATNKESCFGSGNQTLTAIGSNIKWFSDPGLTTLVKTGNSFTPNVTAVGTYTYYVNQNTSCGVSLADTVILTIHAVPPAPVAASVSACANGVIPNLSASGNGIKWYGDSLKTQLLYTGNSYATSQTAAGIYPYYVSQSDAGLGCESKAKRVSLSLTAPGSPAATNQVICFGYIVPQLVAVGENIKWYGDVNKTTNIYDGDSLSTGMNAVGSYTYYATQTDSTGCESAVKPVVLTINTVPSNPPVVNRSVCFGNATPNLSVAGTNVKWYSDQNLSTLVDTGNVFQTGKTAVGVYTYFVTQATSCGVSAADSIKLFINHVPVSPSVSDISSCQSGVIPAFSATGNNVKWYQDSILTTLLQTGSSFAPTPGSVGTYIYFATQTSSSTGCESRPKEATLTLYAPPVPTATDQSVCFGYSVPLLTASGINVKWYSDSLKTITIHSGDTLATGVTAAGIYTYYVTQTDVANTCESPVKPVTLTINSVPASPPIVDQSACVGGTIPNLTNAGTNAKWYSDSLLTNQVAAGNSFATGKTAIGIYTYYVTQSTSCGVSLPDAIHLVIHNLPSAPITSDVQACATGNIP